MNLNTQFVFESKLKRNLIIGMLVGAVCLAWSLVGDDEYHTRFWTNWLHNSVFFAGIAFMAMFFLAAQITAFAGWNSVIKRVAEAMSQFMWVGMILMGVIVLGVWFHFHHLYHWNTPGITDPNSPIFDKILAGKRGFLNPAFFTFAILGVLGIWYYWAYKLRQASVMQDTHETPSFDYYKKQRKWAASFLPLGGFLSTVFLWQSVMAVDPHWYSTMFAWYSMASLWLASMAAIILMIIYLKSKGYMAYVTREHLHDIGKYLFGITVFWTYLWFDQFMLIWYSNNGEETIYFKERMDHYPVLFWGNLLINFVAPFLILMRNDTKRKFGTMFFVAALVFFGHWWDFFYMIKPGARIAAHEAKELSEGKRPGHGAAPMTEPTSLGINPRPHSEVAAPMTEPTSLGVNPRPHSEVAAPMTEPTSLGVNPPRHAEAAAPQESPETMAGHDLAGEGHAEAETAMPAEHSATEMPAGHEEPLATAEAATAAGAHGESHAEPGEHGEGHEHADETKAFKLGYTIPGIQEIGVMIGFLSLFLFFFFNQLSKVSLVPLRDPYLEESLHHHTGVYVDGENELDGDNHDDGHGHH